MPSPWKPKVKYPVRVEQTKQILAMSPSLPIRVLSKLDLVIVTTTKTGTILSTRCRDEITLAVSKSKALGAIEVPIDNAIEAGLAGPFAELMAKADEEYHRAKEER